MIPVGENPVNILSLSFDKLFPIIVSYAIIMNVKPAVKHGERKFVFTRRI